VTTGDRAIGGAALLAAHAGLQLGVSIAFWASTLLLSRTDARRVEDLTGLACASATILFVRLVRGRVPAEAFDLRTQVVHALTSGALAFVTTIVGVPLVGRHAPFARTIGDAGTAPWASSIAPRPWWDAWLHSGSVVVAGAMAAFAAAVTLRLFGRLRRGRI